MESLQHVQSYLYPIAVDIFRLCIWLLLLMLVFIPLERIFSVHPQKILRKAFPADLGLYFLNSFLPKMLLVAPMALIASGMHRIVPDEVHEWVADLPLWLRLVAAFVVGEVGFYWGHRWTHQIPLLWRFHSVHHSAEEIDWLVNTRGHPIDMVFVRLCGFVPMYALGLAQPLAGQKVDVVPLLVMLIATMWGFFLHANLRWRLGWLGLVISTPAFHHWHHTNDEHINRNYASMLPFMDRLFGTWYLPDKQWPPGYGLGAPAAARNAGAPAEPGTPPGPGALMAAE